MGRGKCQDTTVCFVCTTLEFFNADAKTRENFSIIWWFIFFRQLTICSAGVKTAQRTEAGAAAEGGPLAHL